MGVEVHQVILSDKAVVLQIQVCREEEIVSDIVIILDYLGGLGNGNLGFIR